MNWVDYLDRQTEVAAANLYAMRNAYNFEQIVRNKARLSFTGQVFTTYTISFPGFVSQDMSARALDAAGIPEIDDSSRGMAVTGHTRRFLQNACLAVHLARNMGSSFPDTEKRLEGECRESLAVLNSVLGHDRARKFRTALYRNLEAMLPEDEFKAATQTRLLAALGMSKDALKKNPGDFSFHPALGREADREDYRRSFMRLIETMGAYVFNLPRNKTAFQRESLVVGGKGVANSESRPFSADAFFGLKDDLGIDMFDMLDRIQSLHVRLWAHRVNAGQKTPLWNDRNGMKLFGALYALLVGLAHHDAGDPPFDFDLGGPKARQDQMKQIMKDSDRAICELMQRELATAAHAYWKSMPGVTAEALAGNLAPAILEDCGSGRLWKNAGKLEAYLAGLLSPYMRPSPLAPVYARPSSRPQ